MLWMTFFSLPTSIATLAATSWFRHVATTLGLVLAAYLLWEVIRRRILRHSKFDRESALAWQDGSRNVIVILTIGTLSVLWGAEVRSLTLSVAALGATVAIVFKEVFMNLLGAAVRSVSRPFSIGDRVDINGHTGCVVAQTFMTKLMVSVGQWPQMVSNRCWFCVSRNCQL
jgi:small-conductance mechanosensitive channel